MLLNRLLGLTGGAPETVFRVSLTVGAALLTNNWGLQFLRRNVLLTFPAPVHNTSIKYLPPNHLCQMAAPMYTRLINKGDIRVLGILPAPRQDDEVVAKFRVESLSGGPSPEFEALSYMWGDQTVRATINLD